MTLLNIPPAPRCSWRRARPSSPAAWICSAAAAEQAGNALSQEDIAWQELIRFTHPSCQPLLGALQPVIFKDGLVLPELGYELEGHKGEVLAVILDAAQPCFEAAGWRCWTIDDPPDLSAVDTTAATIRDALQTTASVPTP